MKLTDVFVKNAPKAASGKRAEHWDSVVPGLHLRVTDAGVKTWRLAGRLGPGGLLRRVTLGRYPTLSLKGARELAEPLAEDIASGIDPAAKLAEAEAKAKEAAAAVARAKDGTVERLWALYAGRELRGKRRTARKMEKIFAKDIGPAWGARDLLTIRRSDVTRLTDEIIARGSPVQAQRTLEVVRAFFRWAMQRDEAFTNPIAPGYRVARAEVRERVLTDDEIAAFWRATAPLPPRKERRLVTMSGAPLVAGALFRVLLLSGQRLSDIQKATDGEIVGDALYIPASRYKTGRPQTVPLVPEVKAILAALPRVGGNPYLFARFGTTPFQNLGAAKRQVDAAMVKELGTLPEWRVHDLRRTHRTILARCGVAREIAEQVLGHALPTIEATYNKFKYEAEKLDALKKLTALVMRIVRDEKAAVTALRARGPTS